MVNATSKFLVKSEWGHDPLNREITDLVTALDAAKDKSERKLILDTQLRDTINAFNEITSTMSRLLCFVCLSYKAEKLFKLDLTGMENEFRDDEEAFEYWARETLRQSPLKNYSKVMHYLRANNDMSLIKRVSFERAWVISKFRTKFASLGQEIPESILILAESRQDPIGTTDLSNTLDWEFVKGTKVLDYKTTQKCLPSQDTIDQWEEIHKKEKAKKSLAHTHEKPPTDPSYKILHEQLGGLVKGDLIGVRAFLDSLLELDGLKEIDVSDKVYDFMRQRYQYCAISNIPFTNFKPMEIHHIRSRGAITKRNSFNVVPLSREVHQEIHNLGLNAVLQKYQATEELLLAQAIRVTMEYLNFLES